MGLAQSSQMILQKLTASGNTGEVKILMIGLKGAGKTTVLYKLRLGEVLTSSPTAGFDIETCKDKHVLFNSWDVGSESDKRIRVLYKHYYQDAKVVIFVVDAADTANIGKAKEELHLMLQDDMLKDAPLLVFSNKKDLQNAMSDEDVTDKLGLESLSGREWKVQATSAVITEGIKEGLEWLVSVC